MSCGFVLAPSASAKSLTTEKSVRSATSSSSTIQMPKPNPTKNTSLNIAFRSILPSSLLKEKGNRSNIKKSDLGNAKHVKQNSKENSGTNKMASFDVASSTTDSDTPTTYDESVPYFDDTASLTDASSQDYYTFETTSDTFGVIGLTSTNTNYYAALFEYDASEGTYVDTGVAIQATTSNVPTGIYDIPAGQYLVAVFSAGSVGDTYTLGFNATNPINPTSIYNADYMAMVFGYSNGAVYANGFSLTVNQMESGTVLDWTDNETADAGDELNTIYNHLTQVSTLAPTTFVHVSYSSTIGSSNNALLIPLGSSTSFYSNQVFMINGTIIYDSNDDNFGYETPETLAK